MRSLSTNIVLPENFLLRIENKLKNKKINLDNSFYVGTNSSSGNTNYINFEESLYPIEKFPDSTSEYSKEIFSYLKNEEVNKFKILKE